MSKLSTGQPNTLGTYLKNCKAMFGEDSNAVKFLQDKVDEQGEDEEVIMHETQMLYLLGTLHNRKEKE